MRHENVMDDITKPTEQSAVASNKAKKALSANGILGSGVQKLLVYDDEARRMQTPHHLNALRKEGHLCDGVLEVGSRSFPVHRAVLACCSTYFMEQFAGGSRTRDDEISRGKLQHLRFNGFDYNSVEALINYAYTARLECEADQVKAVYKAAVIFKMHGAAEACSEFLSDNLTVQNCLGTRAFANSCCDHELASKSNAFIQQHIQSVIERSSELHRLPTIVVDIVGVEPANLSQEGDKSLCKLVVDWLESVSDEKSFELLAENPHVLYLSSDNNLHDCLEDIPDVDINNCDIVKDYKKLGKRKMMTPLRGRDKNGGGRMTRSTSNPQFTNGNSSSCESLLSVCGEWSVVAAKVVGDKSFMCLAIINDVLSGISIKFRSQPPGSVNGSDAQSAVANGDHHDGGSPTKKDETMDKQCTLTPLANMSSARCALGIGVLDGHLVALGGYDRGECLSSVETFNLAGNDWSPMKPMSVARGRFAATMLSGKLYACGGSNGQVELKSVECYDPSTDAWSHLPDMTSQRTSAGVAATPGLIYVVGGWGGSTGRNSCEVYDVNAKAWRPIADLNQGRSQTAACALDDGRIVAAGGCDAWNCTNTVEIYDPATNRWSYLPPMSIARRGSGVVFLKNKLYVIGGSDGQTSMTSMEIFDMQTGTWYVGPSLCTPRANMGVTIIGRRMFAVGGYSGKAFLNTIEYLCDEREEWCMYQPSLERSLESWTGDESSVITSESPASALNSSHSTENGVIENETSCNGAESWEAVEQSGSLSVHSSTSIIITSESSASAHNSSHSTENGVIENDTSCNGAESWEAVEQSGSLGEQSSTAEGVVDPTSCEFDSSYVSNCEEENLVVSVSELNDSNSSTDG